MNNIPEPQHPIEAVTHPDPYPYYRGLVRERPLYFDDAIHMWVASSAEVVTEVLSNPACRVRPPGEPVPGALIGSAAGEVFGRLVRMIDGEDHPRLKAAVVNALAAVDATDFEARCGHWAEAIAAGDPAALMFQLPVMVMADLIGVGESQIGDAAGWAGDFARGISPLGGAEQIARGADAAGRLRGAVAAAESDVLSRLREHAPDAAVENAVGFLSQAYEATAGLIGNTLVMLGRRPELVDAIRADDGLLNGVIEEVARFDPSVQNTRRWLAVDAVIGGQAMKTGDAILVVLAAANHDPRANESPEVFDAVRANRVMFTFGAGPHACPGHRLAVSIAATGVRRVLASGVDLAALIEGVTYQKSANVRIPVFREGR